VVRPTTVPLDFAAKVRDAVNRSKYHGVDYVDVLNARELLLTPAKERETRVETLRTLHQEWSRWQPHEMLRRKFHSGNPCTPADMYHVMLEFLEEYIEHERTKEW
jgi:hypothetical protein